MRILFWTLAAMGLALIALQLWKPEAHLVVRTAWVVPYGFALGVALAFFGGFWGWRIASQPLRQHERDQLKHDRSLDRSSLRDPHGMHIPSSQIPSILLFFLGFLAWESAGFYAVPVMSAWLFGNTQVTEFQVVGLDYSNRASGFRVQADAVTVAPRNVPSSVFLEAELGDTVLLVGQGTSLGQFYSSIELQ